MTNNDDDRDGRSATARGYVLATRVTSIGMQMAIPPAIGWWADSKFNTGPWLLILGAAFGFTVSMLELVRLAKDSEESDK
ncbi:AtpZ/AtpI family protein [Schlesneria paludicola]|uniref:AtpZ/AtpI family protein n=1 Tax=Schlesneria paludicola TaxID=360056 RepID=UPI00029AF443|nr:AtpZ/AtpI family protein [Schlesneria paludicola]